MSPGLRSRVALAFLAFCAGACAPARGPVRTDSGAASAGAPESVEAAAKAAEEAVSQGTPDPAVLADLERRLEAADPKSFVVWRALGKVLHFEEKYEASEKALNRALALEPGDFQADVALAQVLQETGRDAEAVLLFRKALALKPDTYPLYIGLANSEARLGHYPEARDAFARARKVAGRKSDAYIDEGYFHRDLGELDQAEQAFMSAIAADTTSAYGYHHLGVLLSERKKLPEAERYLREADRLLDADPRAYAVDRLHTLLWLGEVVQAQGRTLEAESVYRRCLEIRAPHVLYVNCLEDLGDVLASEGKDSEVEDVLKRAVAVCEGGPACSCRANSLTVLGRYYLRSGRRAEAAAAAAKAGPLCAGGFESNPAVILSLARLDFDLGDSRSSEALDRKALASLASRPFNPLLPEIQAGLAELDARNGRLDEAVELYRKAVDFWERRPHRRKEAAALDGLAAAYDALGRASEAAAARERARVLRAGPGS